MANGYYYFHFISRGIEAHRQSLYREELTNKLQRQDMCLEKKGTNTTMTHLLSTYYVTGLVPRALHALVHIALWYLWGQHNFYTYFTEKKTEELKHREIKLLVQNYTASSTAGLITHIPISLTPIVYFLPHALSFMRCRGQMLKNLDEGADIVCFTGGSGKAEPSRKGRF